MPPSRPYPRPALRLQDPDHFEFDNATSRWTCLLCTQGRSSGLELWEAIRHEARQYHQNAIQTSLRRIEEAQRRAARAYNELEDDPVMAQLLQRSAISDGGRLSSQPLDSPSNEDLWNGLHEGDEPHWNEAAPWWNTDTIPQQRWRVQASPETQLQDRIRQMMNAGSGRDEPSHTREEVEGVGVGVGTSEANNLHTPTVLDQAGTQRRRGGYNDPVWFPWSNRVDCTFDVISHLPRSVQSEDDIELCAWVLRSNGVSDIPSVKQLKGVIHAMQRIYGIRTLEYTGTLGHTYYINSLGDILRQELANPLVAPHISFYPELSENLKEAKQGTKWLEHMDPLDLTPMLRVRNEDYFIFEPARLRSGSCVLPTRWFTMKNAFGQEQFYGKAWTLDVLAKDGYTSWVIKKHEEVTFDSATLLWNFPRLLELYSTVGLPSPRNIWGYHSIPEVHPNDQVVFRWDTEKYPLPNPWRTKAKGRRVLSMPIWLYCDDTSGNRSKKWNKHNSFLFTLAGLPRAESQRDYNIQFLCTSNLAPPLEMLEGVVQQISVVSKEGVWAYHCGYREVVLITTSVLALLGDNPMQSEFACHLGLRAKFYCRICGVKGRDVEDDRNTNLSSSDESDGDSAEDNDEMHGNQAAHRRTTESLDNLIQRAERAMQTGEIRDPQHTRECLAQIYELAKQPGTAGQRKKLRTQSGVKDTFLETLLAGIDKAAKGKRGQAAEEAITREFRKLPEAPVGSPFSAVWNIRSLNPHSDTPVEILHVLLLGVLKYFWRDAMKHLSSEEKGLVRIRLASIDVTGLDPSLTRVAASTLVTYAGSLVGRDFRVIAQVAPFVLYGLVDKRIYTSWLALGTVVRLCWQPDIPDLTIYLRDLGLAIRNFLDAVVLWSPRWFNKPKFHLLVHLPDQIPSFGPPILTATESFESYNAIIRAWSIHSNRQAPSRDIAHAAARWNRVRHMMSGGFFPDKEDTELLQEDPGAVRWRSQGIGPASLMDLPSIVTRKLGTERVSGKTVGACSQVAFNRLQKMQWIQTMAATVFEDPHSIFGSTPGTLTHTQQYKRAHKVVILNGDLVELSSYVITTTSGSYGCKRVGIIQEILRREHSAADLAGLAEIVLITLCDTHEIVEPYAMPRIVPTSVKIVVKPEEILCSINVQHNCANNNCDNSGTEPVVQERWRMDFTEPRVRHFNKEDIVLNTLKMRDSVHTQHFAPIATAQNRETVLADAKRNYSLHRL